MAAQQSRKFFLILRFGVALERIGRRSRDQRLVHTTSLLNGQGYQVGDSGIVLVRGGISLNRRTFPGNSVSERQRPTARDCIEDSTDFSTCRWSFRIES